MSILVGTGVRSLARARSEWANGSRRATYLLRQVDVPISADERVLPPWRSFEQDGPPLLLSWWAEETGDLPVEVRQLRQDPSVLPSAGRSMGYDVCDFGISLLMNTEWVDETIDPVEYWRLCLGDAHLFVDRTPAEEFCTRARARVTEHPSFVVEVRIHPELRLAD